MCCVAAVSFDATLSAFYTSSFLNESMKDMKAYSRSEEFYILVLLCLCCTVSSLCAMKAKASLTYEFGWFNESRARSFHKPCIP